MHLRNYDEIGCPTYLNDGYVFNILKVERLKNVLYVNLSCTDVYVLNLLKITLTVLWKL